ncbi:transcriptional regulator, XRE family [Actinosynnema mirum DSM 43827]|uniref:Transcriptional regulator, XRE family n=2 Tax=Actinosynnema mirum TaxID=40567 RepID=C6WP48_ACTMD|nr:transcriptional regulator, XRE family [Actinosynnema mirum DSM 43827]
MMAGMASSPSLQLADFLRARRGRVRPDELGLEPGGRRRVSGLRREELAVLAGVSTDYYQRIEQGRGVKPSDEVLDALARALRLTDDETRHLRTLGRAARRPAAPPPRPVERVPESTRRLVDLLPAPAMVLGRHLDVLAHNAVANLLFGGMDDVLPGERNMLRALFLHPDAQRVCPDWEESASEYIGMLRAAAAEDPDHPRARELVGELSLISPEFRRMWARHDVREKVKGVKWFARTPVGALRLDWDAYPLPGCPGPVLVVYTAAAGSVDAERVASLGGLVGVR